MIISSFSLLHFYRQRQTRDINGSLAILTSNVVLENDFVTGSCQPSFFCEWKLCHCQTTLEQEEAKEQIMADESKKFFLRFVSLVSLSSSTLFCAELMQTRMAQTVINDYWEKNDRRVSGKRVTNLFRSIWTQRSKDHNKSSRAAEIKDNMLMTEKTNKPKMVTFTTKKQKSLHAVVVDCSSDDCSSEDCSIKDSPWLSKRSLMAVVTEWSKALASEAETKVSPNLVFPVFQWWKVGMASLYTKSLFMLQYKTTCHQR